MVVGWRGSILRTTRHEIRLVFDVDVWAMGKA